MKLITIHYLSFMLCLIIVITWISCQNALVKPKILNNISGVPEDFVFDKNNKLHLVFSNQPSDTVKTSDIFYTCIENKLCDTIVNLSNSKKNSGYAKIFINKQSNIHLVWLDNCERRGCTQDLYYVNKKDNYWSQPHKFAGCERNQQGIPSSYYIGNISENNKNNDLYLIWNKKFITYYTKISTNGLVHDSVELARGNFYPSICSGYNGKLHIATVNSGLDISGTKTQMDIVYYQLYPKDNTWSNASLVYHHNNNASSSHFVSIVSDSKNTIHIIWQEDVNSDFIPDKLYHAYSSDDGKTWSKPYIINPTGKNCIDKDIAIDNKNELHIVWDEATNSETFIPDKVYYSRFSDSKWTAPENISAKGNKYESYPCIGINSKNDIYVLWNGKLKLDEIGHIYYQIM